MVVWSSDRWVRSSASDLGTVFRPIPCIASASACGLPKTYPIVCEVAEVLALYLYQTFKMCLQVLRNPNPGQVHFVAFPSRSIVTVYDVPGLLP